MPDDIRTEDDLRAGQVGAYPAGLRLSSAQDRLLRRWPLSRIRPKSVALGMRSLIAEVDTLRAERDAAWAAIRVLHDGLEAHPVCVHGPEYDEARWQNGCSFCPLVRPLFDLVPGLVREA